MGRFALHLSLGSACNLDCKYCFKDLDYEKLTKDMAFNLIDQIFQVYKINDINEINLFSTSEPFANRELFWDLYDYIHQKGLPYYNISFTTNGTILDLDKDLERFKSRTYCLISCDGNREQHNRYRMLKTDYYDNIVNNVKILDQSGVRCIAQTVIDGSQDSIFEIAHTLRDIGFCQATMKIVKGKRFTEEEKQNIRKKIEDFYHELSDRIINHNEIYWIYFFNLALYIKSYLYNFVHLRCDINFAGFHIIDLRGNVFKCDYEANSKGQNKIGNIYDQGFNKSKLLRDYNIRFQNNVTKFNNNQICQQCEYRMLCCGKDSICQKYDLDFECELWKIRGKYLKQICDHIKSKYRDDEIRFILGSWERITMVCQNKKYLDIDKLYDCEQTERQIKLAVENNK